MIKQKQTGAVIMVLAVIIFTIGFLYINQTEKFLASQAKTGPNGECIHTGPSCPYEQLNRLAVPKFIGIFSVIALFAVGVYFYLKKKPEEIALKNARKKVKGLGKEESKVFDLVVSADGMIFQNELVQRSQLSKVKVTRLLDRLESKGLIERRRRGMTNVVLLKR